MKREWFGQERAGVCVGVGVAVNVLACVNVCEQVGVAISRSATRSLHHPISHLGIIPPEARELGGR